MIIDSADGFDPAVQEQIHPRAGPSRAEFSTTTPHRFRVGTLAALAKLVAVSQIVYVTSTRFFATRFFQMPEDVVGIGAEK